MILRRKIFVGLTLFFLTGGYLVFKFFIHPAAKIEPKLSAPASPEVQGFSEEIQKRGIEGLKRKQYNAMIVVLERMLQQYPEQVGLKKKLAEAYRAAGKDEKANLLLEEISRGAKK